MSRHCTLLKGQYQRVTDQLEEMSGMIESINRSVVLRRSMNGEDCIELQPDVLNWLRSTSSASSWQPKEPISPASFGSVNEGYPAVVAEAQSVDRLRHSRWRRTGQTSQKAMPSPKKNGRIEHASDDTARSNNRHLKSRDSSIRCVVRRKSAMARLEEGNSRVLHYFSGKSHRRLSPTCSKLRHLLNFKFNFSETTVTCVDDDDEVEAETDNKESRILATSTKVHPLDEAATHYRKHDSEATGTSPAWRNVPSSVEPVELVSSRSGDQLKLSKQPNRSRRDVSDEYQQLDGEFYDADDSWKTGNGDVNVNDSSATAVGDHVNDHHDVFAYAVKMQKIAHMLHYCSIAILGLFVLQVFIKIYAMGADFFAKKIELFDAAITAGSFAIDVVLMNGVVQGEETLALMVVFLLWRVLRLANSLVVASKQRQEFRISLQKRARQRAEKRCEWLESEIGWREREIDKLASLCTEKGATEEEIGHCRVKHTFKRMNASEGLSSVASFSLGLSMSMRGAALNSSTTEEVASSNTSNVVNNNSGGGGGGPGPQPSAVIPLHPNQPPPHYIHPALMRCLRPPAPPRKPSFQDLFPVIPQASSSASSGGSAARASRRASLAGMVAVSRRRSSCAAAVDFINRRRPSAIFGLGSGNTFGGGMIHHHIKKPTGGGGGWLSAGWHLNTKRRLSAVEQRIRFNLDTNDHSDEHELEDESHYDDGGYRLAATTIGCDHDLAHENLGVDKRLQPILERSDSDDASPAGSTDGAGTFATNISELVLSVNADNSTSDFKAQADKPATFGAAAVDKTVGSQLDKSDCVDRHRVEAELNKQEGIQSATKSVLLPGWQPNTDSRLVLSDSANVQSAARHLVNTYRKALTDVPVIVTTDDEDLDKVTQTGKFEFLCRSTNDLSFSSAAPSSVVPAAFVFAGPPNRTQSISRRSEQVALTAKSVPDFRRLQSTARTSLTPSLVLSSRESRTGNEPSTSTITTITPLTNTVAVLSRSQSLEAVRLHLHQRTSRQHKDVTTSSGESHI